MYSVRRDYPRSFTQYMKVWGRLEVEILAQMNLLSAQELGMTTRSAESAYELILRPPWQMRTEPTAHPSHPHKSPTYSQVRNIDNSLYMCDAPSRHETRRAHT
jgi:hypothetical protein